MRRAHEKMKVLVVHSKPRARLAWWLLFQSFGQTAAILHYLAMNNLYHAMNDNNSSFSWVFGWFCVCAAHTRARTYTFSHTNAIHSVCARRV